MLDSHAREKTLLPKILIPLALAIATCLVLWGAGILTFGQAAPEGDGGTSANSPDLSADAGAGQKKDEGTIKVDEKPEIKSSKVAKSKPPKKAGKGIGNVGKPPHGAAIFPDGTWLPPLNGVEIAPRFPGFAPGYPYAPVIKIVKGDKGIDWYIHSDGSHSTTQMALTQQGGRSFRQPAWAVGNPTDTLPVDIPKPAGAGK